MRPADEGKRTAAEAAVALVENGMQLGLGIGLHDALRPGRFGPAGGRGRTAGHRHAYLEADRGAGAAWASRSAIASRSRCWIWRSMAP